MTQDPISQLSQTLRGYAQLVAGMSETNLAPIAGMAIEGVRDWVSSALNNAGGTIAGGAASIEALIPVEIRRIVRQEVESALSGLPGIPSQVMRSELKAAQLRVKELEKELSFLRPRSTKTKRAPGTKVPAKKVPAKKVPAKKVPAKKVPAKKVPAKKLPAKKLPAKKLPAKKVVKPS